MDMQTVHSHRAQGQKGPALGLMRCYHYLEILNNFLSELGLCKQSQQSTCEEGGHG